MGSVSDHLDFFFAEFASFNNSITYGLTQVACNEAKASSNKDNLQFNFAIHIRKPFADISCSTKTNSLAVEKQNAWLENSELHNNGRWLPTLYWYTQNTI